MYVAHSSIRPTTKSKAAKPKVSTWTEKARYEGMMKALKMFSEDELEQMVAESIEYGIELPEPFKYYKSKVK